MKTRLIQIGNSKGIQIPKSFIEQYQLKGEINLIPSKKGLLITSSPKPRDGWEVQFKNAMPLQKNPVDFIWQSFSSNFDSEQ